MEIIDNIKIRKNLIVVLPTFNQYEATRNNILLIKKQTIIPDILIVDNNSLDNTFNLLKKEFKDIIIINTGDNLGGSGGFYYGEKYAFEKKYKYIILSDNDAFPYNKYLIENLLKKRKENIIPNGFNVSDDSLNRYMINKLHWSIYSYEMIKKVGLVNKNYFIYGDDVDYGYRINKYYKYKKIFNAKYIHPMKTSLNLKMLYFAYRNSFFLSILYKSYKKMFFPNIITKYFFYRKISNNSKYIFSKVLKDIKNKNLDNKEILKINIKNNIIFQKVEINDFKYKLNKNFIIKKKIIKLGNIFNKKIISYAPTIDFLFVKEYYFIKNIENNIVEYLVIKNNLIQRIYNIFRVLFFYIKIKVFIFLNKKNIIKMVNSD